MPRDDLSIDFVKRMPPGGEALDPALILDDWINRVANLPEEIRFLQDEIADKDRQYNDCIRIIEERDARIQKWIKANGSHENNPREDNYRKVISENFDKAEQLADEKILLSQKMQAAMDRHIRQLDMQIKQLYDRNEPGFSDPDDVPSLLRSSAANQAGPTIRSSVRSPAAGALTESNNRRKETTPTPAASVLVGLASGGSGSSTGRGSSLAQVRQTQSHQGHSASAPASPAATMILGRQAREGSAGPAPGKRGPRAGSALSNLPTTSSGLARHSSLGPGTPKSHQTASGLQRAGSAGPRATTKGVGAGLGRKAGTPSVPSGLAASASTPTGSGPGRKKGNGAAGGPGLKNITRVKRPPKHSAASSTAESELSEAESVSESNASSRRGTPARSLSHGGAGSGPGSGAVNGGGNGNGNGEKEGSSQPQLKRERDSVGGISGGVGSAGAGGDAGPAGSGTGGRSAVTKHGPGRGGGVAPSSDDRMDIDDDEAGDDRKYCLCQNVSFGDMVACDNEDCPFEWFHWTCVGLKSEPNGTWYCPVCIEKMGGGSGNASSGAGSTSTVGHGSIPIGARKGK